MDQKVKDYLLDPRSLSEPIIVGGLKCHPVEPAGAGYKSVVWKARDDFGRTRALKLATYNDYENRSYLEEITRAAVLEDFSGFARFYSAGIVDVPLGPDEVVQLVAIVEEWVDGITLESYIREDSESVSISFLLGYVKVMCQNLQALRTNGLTHDDLHTGNVMVARLPLGDLYGEPIIKIIDTGSLKRETSRKDRDDHLNFVEHLVDIRNAIKRRRLLTARELRSISEVDALIRLMLDADIGRALRDPAQIREQFELALTRARSTRPPSVDAMQSPFEYISAEHIADDKLLVEIFAKSCPWLEKVSGPDPCLVTGPRGCGKSTIFRWLSLKAHLHKSVADIEPLRLVGFYISCSTDLQNRLGWIKDDATAAQFRREIIHYFNLLAAREVLNTLELISLHPERETYWGFGASQERAVYQRIIELMGIPTPQSIQSVSRLGQGIEAVEAEMSRTHRQMLDGLNVDHPTPETFLGDLTTMLVAQIPGFGDKKITFLIDDFSDHRLPDAVQRILNRIIWERRGSHVFKLSAEKHGALLTDESGAPIDLTREMNEVDCGREYIALDDSRHSRQSLTFAVDLLNRRLGNAGYVGSAETLIGESKWPGGSLARALLAKKGRMQDQYHGLRCIADLCSGDVATLLQVYRRIFERAGVTSNQDTLIDKRTQHDAIVSVSREQLDAIKANFPHGPKMYDIANAFGNLVRRILESGKDLKKGTSTVPSQIPRIEVDQTAGNVVDQLTGIAQELARTLVKRSVFIEMEPGRSRHSNVTTLRWHFRRVYLPAFGAALAKNDAVKVQPDWIKFFLTNPKEACDSMWQAWRTPTTGDSKQLSLPSSTG